jgi:hypothetical protein
MQQTQGKVVARNWFYQYYLPSILSPRTLRSSNFLLLLGEDFRELELLEELGVPQYRTFSVERDQKIFHWQRTKARRDDLEVVLHFGDLSEYIQDYLRTEHRISVFNLDICGPYLSGIDPALGKLLLFARRNPSTVMATYSSAGRDRAQLMEGLKSLVVLLWLAPEAVDRLVRHTYGQYRSVELGERRQGRDEVDVNLMLRHLFWFRSHLEHIAVGATSLGATSYESVVRLMSEEERIWQQFLSKATFPLTYEAVTETVMALPRPELDDVRMDVSFGDVQFLTYAANNGFYQNCYFATYEHDGSSLSLGTWMVESARTLRSNNIVIIDVNGEQCPSTYGQVAVYTDKAVVWSKADLSADLRMIAIPPPSADRQIREEEACSTVTSDELTTETIEQIHALAREGKNSREISEKLSLKLPLAKIAAQVAVARRKIPSD